MTRARALAVLSGLYALLACGLMVYALQNAYERWQAGEQVITWAALSLVCLSAALRAGQRAAQLWKEGSRA